MHKTEQAELPTLPDMHFWRIDTRTIWTRAETSYEAYQIKIIKNTPRHWRKDKEWTEGSEFILLHDFNRGSYHSLDEENAVKRPADLSPDRILSAALALFKRFDDERASKEQDKANDHFVGDYPPNEMKL